MHFSFSASFTSYQVMIFSPSSECLIRVRSRFLLSLLFSVGSIFFPYPMEWTGSLDFWWQHVRCDLIRFCRKIYYRKSCRHSTCRYVKDGWPLMSNFSFSIICVCLYILPFWLHTMFFRFVTFLCYHFFADKDAHTQEYTHVFLANPLVGSTALMFWWKILTPHTDTSDLLPICKLSGDTIVGSARWEQH